MKEVPLDLILLVDVAASYGVTADGLCRFLRRARKPLYKVNGRNAATVATLLWYEKRRERKALSARKRPAGWVGSKQAAELAELTIGALHQMLPCPQLTSVKVGRLYYFDPAEVKALRAARTGVAPGWIALVDLARSLSVDDKTVNRIAKTLKLNTRRYKLPAVTRGPMSRVCITLEDAERITERLKWPDHYPDRLKTLDVAREMGVQRETVFRWSQRGLPKVRCRYMHSWYDLNEVRAWLAARAA